jgi:hypothetical protein
MLARCQQRQLNAALRGCEVFSDADDECMGDNYIEKQFHKPYMTQ